MEEKYLESLEKVGLTKSEAKVYFSLIELKESQTGDLCKNSEIPSSNIYFILDSLIKKGFVSYRLQNNIKVFMPSSPEIINKIFQEKKENIEKEGTEITNLIKTLKEKQSFKESFSKYRYFEGLAAIKSLWFELTENLKKLDKDSIIKVYAGRRASYEALLPIFEEFHKIRTKLKIRYEIIYPIEETKLGEKRKKQFSEVRYMKLDNEAEFAIVGNKLILQYITQKVPRAFLIEDEIFTKTHEQIFATLWKQAKP